MQDIVFFYKGRNIRHAIDDWSAEALYSDPYVAVGDNYVLKTFDKEAKVLFSELALLFIHIHFQ